MKIIILGSEGFIGKHCINFFQKNGHEIHGCDLFDPVHNTYSYYKISRLMPDFEKIFEQEFDVCINCSGSGSVPLSISSPLTDFEANCLDVVHLLELIRKKSPHCKYLHLSSAAVYGNPVHLPIQEESELSPLSPYGWHKLISEKICEEYSKLYTLKIAILRPFSVFGPGLKKQLFWDIYQKCLSKKEIEILGSGNESRDFIYIEDLVIAIDSILKHGELNGEKYNVANGEEVSIKEAVQSFITLHAPEVTCVFTGINRPEDPINWRADNTKLKKLGYMPSYSFMEGLKKTSIWMKNLN